MASSVVISTLMVLLSKSNEDFQSLWEQTGGVNEAAAGDVAKGNFRSVLIDDWTNEAFETMTIAGVNMLGDMLWETEFNVTGTTSDLTAWLDGTKIINSSAMLTGQQIVVTSDLNYRIRIGPAGQSDKAWFAITYGSQSYGPFPAMFAARSPSLPFGYPPILVGLQGCWHNSQMTRWTSHYDDAVANSPAKCIESCKSGSFTAAVLVATSKCFCADYDTNAPPYDYGADLCYSACPGETGTNPVLCGGFDLTSGNAYHVPAPGTVANEELISTPASSETGDIWLDLIQLLGSGGPFLVTETSLKSTVTTATFALNYSNLPCTPIGTMKTFSKYINSVLVQTFPVGTPLDVGTLLVKCLKIITSEAIPAINITISGPISTSEHFEVPAVIVIGQKTVIDTTSTSTTTTSTTATTTSTSTTIPTTTTSTTTTPTTTSTASTTTATTPTTTTVASTTPPTTPTTTTVASTTPPTTPTTTTVASTTPPTTPTTTTVASTTPPTTTTTAPTTTTTASSTTTPTTTTASTTTSQSAPTSTTASSGSVTSTSTTSAPKCFCPCSGTGSNINLTAKEIQEKIAIMQKELAVNTSELSSTIRKLTSAEDKRPSAVSIGVLGVALLVTVFGSIVFIDSALLFRDLKTLISNIKSGIFKVKQTTPD